jgi:hypothetical protein
MATWKHAKLYKCLPSKLQFFKKWVTWNVLDRPQHGPHDSYLMFTPCVIPLPWAWLGSDLFSHIRCERIFQVHFGVWITGLELTKKEINFECTWLRVNSFKRGLGPPWSDRLCSLTWWSKWSYWRRLQANSRKCK